ncbi:MAG: hypothetical protein ACXWZS_18395 [Gemmatirosa sp.]
MRPTSTRDPQGRTWTGARIAQRLGDARDRDVTLRMVRSPSR